MGALSMIEEAGFSVVLDGNSLNIKPASKLTMQQREFLKSHKAEIVTELQTRQSDIELPIVKCGDCLNFKCFNAHGKGAGHCLVGAKDRLWSDQERDCESYRLKVAEGAEPKTIIVTCYIPNGNPVKVQAASEEYTDWLIKMNPKPKRKP